MLAPGGTLVLVGGPRKNRLLGPLGGVVRKLLGGAFGSRKVVFFIAKLGKRDLEFLCELLADGELTPVVDRRYELSEVGEAFTYLGEGHPRGKVVVTV